MWGRQAAAPPVETARLVRILASPERTRDHANAGRGPSRTGCASVRASVYRGMVRLQRDLSESIRDAIEASYYVSPEAPGLTPEELATVLAEFGFQVGEINDALRSPRSGLGGTANGYVFLASELANDLTEHGWPFAEDPRDWDVFAFVQERLQTLARERGIAAAKLNISQIYIEGEALGLDSHQLRLAVHGLSLMKLTAIDRETNTISLTHQGSNWVLVNRRYDASIEITSRPNMPKLIRAVQKARERRDPAVRWLALRSELSTLATADSLTLEERLVLDDITARFADGGEPVSLDDVLRRLPELEVKQIAAGLVDQEQLHRLMDNRVVPTLLAILRHVNVFGRVLGLANEALRRAKELWENKENSVALGGPRGLLGSIRAGAATPLEVRQFSALLEGLSLRPALMPSMPGRAEIRDEVRHAGSLVQLIEHQKQLYQRRPPTVVVIPKPSSKVGDLTMNETEGNPGLVFVVHGRNTQTLNELTAWLDAVGLHAKAFEDVRAELGGAPTILQVVEKGISEARGVIILITPDELAFLRPELQRNRDTAGDRQRWQARPNVLFEAGLAYAKAGHKRTLFLVAGVAELFSDVGGIVYMGLPQDPESKERLKTALASMGCTVRTDPKHHQRGNFPVAGLGPMKTRTPFEE